MIAGLALAAGATTAARAGGPGYRISLAQLEGALAERFPLRYPVSGLFDLTVDTPRLRLLPELNRLGSELLLQAAGPALQRSYRGDVDLDFALRYEAADRTIRAQHLRVNAVHMDGLNREGQLLLQRAAADMARQSLAEVVLHRLRPGDLALADAMGLQPGAITVTPAGLAVDFVNKPAS